MEQLAWEKCWK